MSDFDLIIKTIRQYLDYVDSATTSTYALYMAVQSSKYTSIMSELHSAYHELKDFNRFRVYLAFKEPTLWQRLKVSVGHA
jgi:hypothetical protein